MPDSCSSTLHLGGAGIKRGNPGIIFSLSPTSACQSLTSSFIPLPEPVRSVHCSPFPRSFPILAGLIFCLGYSSRLLCQGPETTPGFHDALRKDS